jgi:LPS-assembly lipoprotein
MSWSSDRSIARAPARVRLAALAVLGVALAGCGFHPLYGDRQKAEVDVDLSSISVSLIPERIGQLLAISLRDSLNPTDARVLPRYVLTINVSTSTSDLAIRSDGTASRQAYAANASFSLHEAAAGSKEVLRGSARAYDSFDVGENPYTTIVADSDAEKRAAQTMSEQIRTQLAVFMRRQASRS